MNKFVPVTLLSAALLLAGCATVKQQDEAPQLLGDPQQPYAPEREPQVGNILHIPTGLYVDQQQMLQAVTDSRIVYVGETHDNPAAHRLQLAILKAMAERYPGQVAFGMEMFIPAQQQALDRWVAGELDEPAFLREARWHEVWRDDFAHYRELLEFCRDNNIPVRGLNVDRQLVRAVGRTAPDQLSEEIRQQLPDMDFVDEYQQAMVAAVFSGHGPVDGGHVKGFKRVQTLWDQTMAENIVNFLQSPEGQGKRMVVIAGGNHVRYGYGIPRRVFRLMPSSYSLVGSKEIVIPEEKQDQIMDVTMPRFPMTAYDYVAFTEYESLPPEGVKLGVLFSTEQGGLDIQQVMPDSSAQAAGLQANDRVTHFDGRLVKDMYDIKHELRQKQPGDKVALGIERDGQVTELDVVFQ